jgi:hypothetical protein
MPRSFELLQPASFRTFQQHARMTLSVRPAMGFPYKTHMGRLLQPSGRCGFLSGCAHPEGKLRFKIQTSGRQPSWFGRASYLYGNSVHLINRPDDHYLGLDARSLDMKIACSRSASVRMTRQHCSDTAQIKKEFQRNFGNPIAQLSIRMPYVHRPDGA